LDNIAYVEYLLNNYHEIKKQINHLKMLINSPIYETSSETIEELNFKDTGVFHPGRSP